MNRVVNYCGHWLDLKKVTAISEVFNDEENQWVFRIIFDDVKEPMEYSHHLQDIARNTQARFLELWKKALGDL